MVSNPLAPIEVDIGVPMQELRAQLSSMIDPPGYRGWPRKDLMGTVGAETLILMKVARRSNDMFLLTFAGRLTDAGSHTIVRGEFRRSWVRGFFTYAVGPVFVLTCLVTWFMVAIGAVQHGFEPAELIGPLLSSIFVVIVFGLATALKSTNRSEATRIRAFLESLQARTSHESATA